MDTNSQTDPVVDADVVNDTDTSTPTTSTDTTSSAPTAVNVIMDLENMIKSHITGLDTRRDELKKLKEMMESSFKNDPAYQQALSAVKDATKQKKDAKARLMRLPEVHTVSDKVNELSTEVKEMDGALSDYLREYQRLTGSNEIQMDDGQVHEIVYTAKLLKKGK